MTVLTSQEAFPVMLSFVEEAGRIALDLIGSSKPELKADLSVITDADMRISALAAKRLAPFLASPGHVMIDEEDPRRGDYLDNNFLDSHPFVWSLDPVDATRAYANGMPHYAVSLGLIKDRSPWLGVVYFPSLKELFYCDGDAAYFVKDAFTPAQVKIKIVPVDEKLSDRSVFIASDDIVPKFEWKQKECRVMVFSAAVCEFCWPAIGRGCGSLAKVHLWDLAGSWPLFQHAGLKLYSFTDGAPLERLEAASFLKGQTPWKLKDYYILSSPRNYLLFKERLLKKGGS